MPRAVAMRCGVVGAETRGRRRFRGLAWCVLFEGVAAAGAAGRPTFCFVSRGIGFRWPCFGAGELCACGPQPGFSRGARVRGGMADAGREWVCSGCGASIRLCCYFCPGEGWKSCYFRVCDPEHVTVFCPCVLVAVPVQAVVEIRSLLEWVVVDVGETKPVTQVR